MFARRAAVVAATAVALITLPVIPSSATPSGGCAYPPNPPVLTIDLSPRVIIAGHLSEVFGHFTQNNCGIQNAIIAIQRRELVNSQPFGSWATVEDATTDSSGIYTNVVDPRTNEQLRAVFQAAGRFPSTLSSTATLEVRTNIDLSASAKSLCAVHISGTTSPAKPFRTIAVQTQGPAGHFNGYTSLWYPKTDKFGHYSSTHTLKCGTTYNLSTYIGPDSINLAGRSPTVFGIRTHR
jgi:hypothetical protein